MYVPLCEGLGSIQVELQLCNLSQVSIHCTGQRLKGCKETTELSVCTAPSLESGALVGRLVEANGCPAHHSALALALLSGAQFSIFEHLPRVFPVPLISFCLPPTPSFSVCSLALPSAAPPTSCYPTHSSAALSPRLMLTAKKTVSQASFLLANSLPPTSQSWLWSSSISYLSSDVPLSTSAVRNTVTRDNKYRKQETFLKGGLIIIKKRADNFQRTLSSIQGDNLQSTK